MQKVGKNIMQPSYTTHLSSITYKKPIPEWTVEQNFHPRLKTSHNKMSAMYAHVNKKWLFDNICTLHMLMDIIREHNPLALFIW